MKETCCLLNCSKELYVKALCRPHYRAVYEYTTLAHKNRKTKPAGPKRNFSIKAYCSKYGCLAFVHGRGLCNRHYRQCPDIHCSKLISQQKHYQRNLDSQRQRAREKYQDNKKTYRSYVASRRARKLLATPKWSERQQIKNFYKACPDGYHVDHIVPLQGAIVSGLHVLANLQYLPAAINISKGNRYE